MAEIQNLAAETFRCTGTAPIVLVCEHASNTIPDCFDGLGIGAEAHRSHAAWDIGALDVANGLSQDLDAPLVCCTVSRLVYDCNRPLEAIDCIPARSERYGIPGNRNLSEGERRERFTKIHNPFHDAVARAIESQKSKTGVPPTVVTVHSFTPVYDGEVRSLDIGFVHDTDPRVAEAALEREKEKGTFRCALNEPYDASNGVTYSLKKHTAGKDVAGVMLEIRNDLIDTPEKASMMARHLADTLKSAIGDARRICGQT